MFNQNFYNSTTRKYVILFGNMFNDIVVRRFNSDGTEAKALKVPISYSPKVKWLEQIRNHPQDVNVANILPRLGFEITGFSYDPSRMINPVHSLVKITDDNNKMLAQFVPTPYKLNFELYALTKYSADGLQIAEQILPFFTPDFTASLNLIPGLGRPYDIRTDLVGVSQQDGYEGSFQERRVIIWTFSFEMHGWYFGPIRTQGVIKRVQVDLHSIAGQGVVTDEEITRSGRIARVVVKPGLTASGGPTSNAALSIPYSQIDAEDDYGFITEHYTFTDGRKYDPVSGEDR